MTLLQAIEQHLKRSGQPHTNFGRAVGSDPNLVKDMRIGRAVGEKLAGRIARYIADRK
jgi:hypothetical protein